MTPTDSPPSVLKTLAPSLRETEQSLRSWLHKQHRYPIDPQTRAGLENSASDLHRQADALDRERPILIILLMGGTGVGKSTLLNALAGGQIAQASFARPTTRDPVVYYHESIRNDRFDPALQHCRLIPHDRMPLEQKVIVDTPDLDSNDLINREKLAQLLPVADIVLYVGSQEKYHDRLGWELFLQHRRRKAFAFVLNKWDRCARQSSTGLLPDEDLLRDLKAEGFKTPLLFRTCAQLWVDRASGKESIVPQGEQFTELVHWIEMDLSRVEIEAIKSRGVTQLLAQLEEQLNACCPPDLTEASIQTRIVWGRLLSEESRTAAEVLLHTLDPYQREVEHHFALQGQRRFRGMMAGYLHVYTRLRYLGSQLRDRVPFISRSREENKELTWNLATFTAACSETAVNTSLEARIKALGDRLLLEAGRQQFPIGLLAGSVESLGKIDWRRRFSQSLSEVLQNVERTWTRPSGVRKWVQAGLVFLADWLPLVVLAVTCGVMLWQYFYNQVVFKIEDALMPVVVVLATLVILHILIALLLPLRWHKIRSEFHRQLQERLQSDLINTYGPVPGDVAAAMRSERQEVEQLKKKARETIDWLKHREQSTTIAGLYGN